MVSDIKSKLLLMNRKGAVIKVTDDTCSIIAHEVIDGLVPVLAVKDGSI